MPLSSGTRATIDAGRGNSSISVSWDGSISGTIILTRDGRSARIVAGALNGPIRVESVR